MRHIRRMRGLYEERRDCLLMHAKHYLDGVLNFDKTPSGLHLVGWLPDGADEPTLVQHANQRDLTVYPLSALRRGAPGRAGLLLGFAAFTETEIKAGVQQLAQVVRQG